MPRKPPPQHQTPRTQLLIPRQDAEKRLQAQIEKGREIRDRDYSSESDLLAGQEAKEQWTKYTEELLKRAFSTDEYAVEFACAGPVIAFIPFSNKLSLGQRLERLRDLLRDRIKALESILERLDLVPEMQMDSRTDKGSEVYPAKVDSRKVFVVHGHDEHAKQSVARYLEKLDLVPIILHEQPNEGRTIIEKFEACSDVAFTVVLFTPDDVGASKEDKEDLRPRARQNVVFELGYFIGKMGRSKVCVLHKEPVEILSDYEGVLHVPMDNRGAWKTELGRELKQAGIEIDLNKVI